MLQGVGRGKLKNNKISASGQGGTRQGPGLPSCLKQPKTNKQAKNTKNLAKCVEQWFSRHWPTSYERKFKTN